jgi:hypothetical protein
MLTGGLFPSPIGEEAGSPTNLQQYLQWDDWRVLGLIAAGSGGEHGARIAARRHYRAVHHTPEVPSIEDIDRLERAKTLLGKLLAAEQPAEKSWYKTDRADIPIQTEDLSRRVVPLSQYSSVAANIKPSRQTLLYVKPEDADKARVQLQRLYTGKGKRR